MNHILIKSVAVLVVLLISLISISSAAGLHAASDLYKGQCGKELSVPAPGILKNDAKIPESIDVMDPEMISIDPKYGTLTVNADGSFVYDASQNFPSSNYVYFYYRTTDGKAVSNQALVKIAVSCVCHGAAPDVTVSPGTAITPEFLMSEGAGCMGCRDVTPKFDLSQTIGFAKAGACNSYTVSCPGGSRTEGHICFVGSCEPVWEPFTVCPGVTPTVEQIMAEGSVTCDCDTDPVISNILMVNDHWDYTITCTTAPGYAATGTGIVNIGQACEISASSFTFLENNPGSHTLPTPEEIMELGAVSCGCDATPVISNIHWVSTPSNDEWIGEYTITCTSADGCASSDTAQFSPVIVDNFCCQPAAPDLSGCVGSAFPMDLFTSLGGGCNFISDCDVTSVIDDSQVDYSTAGTYPYTVTCSGCPAGNNLARGQIFINELSCDAMGNNCFCPVTVTSTDPQ